MLFDDLCRLAERTLPDLRPLCRKARIFRFETEDHSSARAEGEAIVLNAWTDDERQIENLRMPFDTVLFESAESRESRGSYCTLLHAPDSGRVWDYYILKNNRVESDVLYSGSVQYFPDGVIEQGNDQTAAVRVNSCCARYFRKDRLYREHTIDVTKMGGVFASSPAHAEYMEATAYLRDEHGQTQREFDEWMAATREPDLPPERRKELLEFADQHAEIANARLRLLEGESTFCTLANALLALLWINRPTGFVLEETPTANLPKPKPGQLVRSPWRPHYIVLEPDEIRRRLKLAPPENAPGSKVAPHERRGHFRRYRSPRYINRQGQLQWIEATWIGPREAVLGPNRYVVRTDL